MWTIAAETDIDALLALMERYYAEDGYPFAAAEARAAVARLLREPARGRIWIARDARGHAVGHLAVTIGYSLEYRGLDAFVDELYLLPEHRGRGLGTRALALTEAACREWGVRALHLEVERDKTSAQALYRRWGFVDHRRHLMTKPLG